MFDFCGHMEALVRDIADRMSEFTHVDCDRVLFSVSQQRKFGSSGLQAYVVPLRFEGGSLTQHIDNAAWGAPPFFYDGREILYVVSFCLPRYLNLSYEEKGRTLFHELFHISPNFDGDIRRLPGPCYQHGRDPEAYDAHVTELFKAYATMPGTDEYLAFLKSRFHNHEDRWGEVSGTFVSIPSPVQLEPGFLPFLEPHQLRVRRRPVRSARSKV